MKKNAARYAAVFCDCESEKTTAGERRLGIFGGLGKISVTLTVIVAVAAILLSFGSVLENKKREGG